MVLSPNLTDSVVRVKNFALAISYCNMNKMLRYKNACVRIYKKKKMLWIDA